uniref:Expansin-like EG45 domain-containing protein n=2 Tax=Leersia perrieri TaxID=77586 RepID=A0A0D9VN96_9ORYZ
MADDTNREYIAKQRKASTASTWYGVAALDSDSIYRSIDRSELMAGRSRSFRSVAVAAALLCLLAAHGCSASKHHKPKPKPKPSPGGAISGNASSSSNSSTTPPPAPPLPTPPTPTPAPIPTPTPSPGSSSSNGSISGGGGWLNARATWYGAPNGAGPDDNGGACGFKNVNLPPFSAMTSCGNEPLFKDGKGCGSCYQIRCVAHQACSGVPEIVIITDMNYYPVSLYHFDLSGTAFGAMAKDNRNDELRHAGIIDIQFRRVPCQYAGLTVTFHVEQGSNPNYLAILVEYENGDGDVVQVDIMESRPAADGTLVPTGVWTPMRESWGSIWRLDTNHPQQGPFSLRITNESGKSLVADDVIPADWQPNAVYSSLVQFDD